jgi:6-phosphogluconolactonase
MNGALRIFDNEAALFEAAADKFVTYGSQAIAERGRFTVSLAGGGTPKSLYERLAGDTYRTRIDWSKIEWFFGDERPVGPTDPESNYRMASEALLGKPMIDASRVHRIIGEHERPETAAAEYQKEIARVFGIPADGPPPAFDLVLLGMGSDGHTASLFPFTSALNARKKWVSANDVPQMSTRRYTLTPLTINAATCVMFLVTGPGKAKTLRDVLNGPAEPKRLPSQMIKPVAGELWWYVDRAAASQLE